MQIIDYLAAKCGSKVRKLFGSMPADAEEEAYRRDVYKDVKKKPVFDAFIKFIDRLTALEDLKKKTEKVLYDLQMSMWGIRMVDAYCGAYAELAHDLKQAEPESEGLQVFLKIVEDILATEEFKKGIEHTGAILKEIRETHFIITYEKDRISIALGEVPGDGDYEKWASSVDGAEISLLENPTAEEIPILVSILLSALMIVVMLPFSGVGDNVEAATTAAKITTQPKSIYSAAGTTAKFTVAATGTGTLKYQWQSRKDSSASWANSGQTGAKTATLSVSVSAGLHGWQFRCIVTDANGSTATSNAATLMTKVGILTQTAMGIRKLRTMQH